MSSFESAVRLIAQWLLIVPALIMLWSIASRKKWRVDVLEAVVSGALTILLVKIAGASYFHARPFVEFGMVPLVPHVADNGFPSDHLAACGLAIGYLWKRNLFAVAAVILCAGAIGAARVLAELHWPADIAAGLALGIVAAILGRLIVGLAVRYIGSHRRADAYESADAFTSGNDAVEPDAV
jgi:undecaprenyl-diphosphatase